MSKTTNEKMEKIARVEKIDNHLSLDAADWQLDVPGQSVDILPQINQIIENQNRIVNILRDILAEQSRQKTDLKNQQSQITKLEEKWDNWLDNFDEELIKQRTEGINS